MDFNYIDEYMNKPEDVPPTATEAQDAEKLLLTQIAQNIPFLEWNYNGVDVPDTGTKLGLITQSLKRVPGLASMVGTDENGIQNYNSGLLAGAALAAVAALAREVMGIKLSENYAQDPDEQANISMGEANDS